MLFWSAGLSSFGNVPVPLVIVDGHLPAPPLLPLGQGPVIAPPQQPLIPRQPGSYHVVDDEHSVATIPHSAIDQLSADDASVTPSSQISSRHPP